MGIPSHLVTSYSALYARFPVFDGVRAISILWVVFFHAPVVLPAWIEPIRVRGFLGVDLFFSISGFLVTRSLIQCTDRDILREPYPVMRTAQDFLVRRISRIFPPYFLMLLVVLPLVCLLNAELRERVLAVRDIFWSFPVFLANYFIPHSENVVPSILSINWSLSFEEQFYIGLLLFFLLTGKRYLPHLLLAAGMSSVLLRLYAVFLSDSPPPLHQMQLMSYLRIDALLWAALAWLYFKPLGWLWAHEWRGRVVNITIFLGVISSVALSTLYPSARWMAVIYCFTGFFFALMVRAFCEPRHRDTWIVRLLSSQLLVAVGIVSYEIYLIHMYILGYLRVSPLSQNVLVCTLASLSIPVALGWLFHRAYSKPIEKWLRAQFSSRVW